MVGCFNLFVCDVDSGNIANPDLRLCFFADQIGLEAENPLPKSYRIHFHSGYYGSDQIVATSHDLGPQKVAFRNEGKSLYFRRIQVGEIISWELTYPPKMAF